MNRTVIIITHVIPFPPAAGNEIRILKMITWLKRKGFEIVLLLNADCLERRKSLEKIVGRVHLLGDDYGITFKPIPHQKKEGLTLLKEKLEGQVVATSFFQRFFGEARQKKMRSDDVKKSLAPERLIQITGHLCEKYQPCAVVAEYIFTAPCLEVVPPGILKIIDTHDMFCRRKEQVISYGIEDPLPCTPREERSYLLKSDLIIAIQSNEARLFRKLVPERRVITVGIDYDIVPEIDDGKVVPGRILVVGSDNPLNVHGLNEFYRHAWPAIRNRNPEAVLRVVGKIGNHLSTRDDRVRIAGWVEDLDEEYREAAVVINPTVAGTGLKIKSVEALCKAKPLLATPNSVEGLDYTGDAPFVVCRDWKEFSESILALLASEEKRRELQERALRFARENFSAETIYAPLGESLAPLCAVRHPEKQAMATI
jgi:glycosyltransferase involved in cell wall biosynthesis